MTPQLDVEPVIPFKDRMAEVHASQAGMTREQVKDQLASQSEYVFDPETVTPITHNWVDRGLKLSCEGAGHPHHYAWKPIRK